MKDILSEIIAHKQTEIELQKQTVSPEQLQEQAGIIIRENAAHRRSMKQALAASSTGIISEFKRRSPSKGWINEAARAEEIPAAYEAAGAAALSILTDEKFFGGTLRDSLWAGLLGLIIGFVTRRMDKLEANPFFSTIAAAFAMAVPAYLAAAFGLVDYADAVIIGSLMILVPGLLITNSMRDIIYGDTNSGVNRIVQVLLSALAIAMGTAAAWHITSSLYGQTAASTLSYPFWLQAIAIAVACTGFVILFNVHGWGRCLCALGGVVTWMAYLLCGELGLGPYGANFIAAAVAAVYAEGMARARKYPVTSYQVISAVPLLPGAGIYYTMSLGLNGSTQLALQRGFATAGIAGSIAAAILLVSSVVRLFTAQRKK